MGSNLFREFVRQFLCLLRECLELLCYCLQIGFELIHLRFLPLTWVCE